MSDEQDKGFIQGSWGAWDEDRLYPSKDGTHMIVVSKRVDSTGKTHWKNERKRLSAGEIAYVRGLTVDSGER